MNVGIWNLIESILSEDKKFRGDTFVTYADVAKLVHAVSKKAADKKGGTVFGDLEFDPNILALGDSPKGDIAAWTDDMGDALAKATTDSAKQIQGGGMGGTMTKGNWGGKVAMSYAPRRPHHNDRLGSGMDRYDVLIVADIEWTITKRGNRVPVGTIRRVAWSPSIGTQEERAQRLQGLMAGRQPEPPRRPMADRPGISKDDEKRWSAQAMRRNDADVAASDPRSVATPSDAEPPAPTGGGGLATNQSFKDRLAKLNKSYEPSYSKRHQKPTDPEDALFWTPDKKER